MEYDWKKIVLAGPNPGMDENLGIDPVEKKEKERDKTGQFLDGLERKYQLELLQVYTPEEVKEMMAEEGMEYQEGVEPKRYPMKCGSCGKGIWLRQDADHCWYGKCDCGKKYFLSPQEFKRFNRGKSLR